MKHCIYTLAAALLFGPAMGQKAQPAGEGYEIVCNIKPYKNQWLYMAYYYGGIKGLADSAFVSPQGTAVFKSDKPYPQGVYILASPAKTILCEMLIGPDQHFTVSGDTTDMDKSLTFTGSAENTQFLGYTRFVSNRAVAIDSLRKLQSETTDEARKKELQAAVEKPAKEIEDYRKNVIKSSPDGLLSLLFKSMQDVSYPAELRSPKNRQDTIAQYRFGKAHYWDNINLMDGRLVRTPIFEPKLRTYLESWVSPDPDSLIQEFNWMIALGRNDPEMERYLVGYFIDNYINPKFMGQDRVFIHVYDRYVAGDKPKADWLNEKQLKTIRERYYMLVANQLGSPAWDMDLVDTAGKARTLYSLNARYTIVAFWDVHCGKCREEMPKLDSLYKTEWKNMNVGVYAVMVNEESVKDWKPFIADHKLDRAWVHVHQTDAMRKEEEKTGKPNFRQLYDMRSTPTLFLLDKDKKIIAKNIGLNDLDRVLKEKEKQQAGGKTN